MRIQSFTDILQALRDHPEWLAELRALILTEELLALPARFTVMEERQDRMEQRQDRMEQRLDGIDVRLDGIDVRLDRMDSRQDRMERQLDRLLGAETERRYRQHGAAYFGRIARKVRLLSRADRDKLLDSMEDTGLLTSQESDEIRMADGVFSARRDGDPVYLLLEASNTVAREDVTRAVARAGLLARTGVPVLPIVAGESIPDDIAHEAQAHGVWVVTNGTVVAPAA